MHSILETLQRAPPEWWKEGAGARDFDNTNDPSALYLEEDMEEEEDDDAESIDLQQRQSQVEEEDQDDDDDKQSAVSHASMDSED